MARKYFCDKCTNEVPKLETIANTFTKEKWELCNLCYTSVVQFITDPAYGQSEPTTNSPTTK